MLLLRAAALLTVAVKVRREDIAYQIHNATILQLALNSRVFIIKGLNVQPVHNAHLAFVPLAPQIQPLLSIAIKRTTKIALQTLNVSQIIAAQQVYANHIPLVRFVQTIMCVLVFKLAQMDIVNGLITLKVNVPVTTIVKVDFAQLNPLTKALIYNATVKLVNHVKRTQIVFQIIAAH